MADRSVKVTFRANVADFKAQVRSAGQSLDDLVKKADKTGTVASTGLGRMAQSMQLQREHWDAAGSTITAFGVASTAALAGSTKAAIDWESSFAGVRKTVDTSEAGYKKLNEELREMARTLPASHAEIAAVAEAAGQLGVSEGNITSFTRTMIDMGESTSMSAEEAATTLARFANIMGTSQTEFSNLGSSIVELGNNFATTESEIAHMAMRLASAGNQIGLTEGDVLGIATALSSVGIEAEAGGTAFSRVMLDMRKAVDTNSSQLETFAKVAGVSAEEFAAAFRDDAGQALTSFIQGLGEMEAAGQSTQPILEELGMTDIRVGNALRSSAASADLFTEAMEMGNAAYAENTALSAEAAARYETTASQLSILKNNVVDAAISLGEVFLPAINWLIEPLTSLVSKISELPEPVRNVIAIFGALGSAASLAVGGFLLLAPRVMDTVTAFKALKDADILGISSHLDKLNISGSKLAKGGGTLALLAAGFAAVSYGMEEIGATTEELAGAFNDLAASGETVSQALTNMHTSRWTLAPFRDEITTTDQLLDKFSEKLQIAWDGSLENKIARIIEPGGGNKTKEYLEEIDDALASLVSSGNGDAAADIFRQMMEQAESLNLEISQSELESYFDDYLLGANAASAAGAGLAESTDATVGAFGELEAATGEVVSELQQFITTMAEAAGINMSVDQAAIDYARTLETVGALTQSAAYQQANATEQDRLRREALMQLTQAGLKEIEALNAQSESAAAVGFKMQGLADDVYSTALQMGYNADEAWKMTQRYLGVPSNVKTKAEFDHWNAMQNLQTVGAAVGNLNGKTAHLYVNTHFRNIGSSAGAMLATRGGGGFAYGGWTGPGSMFEPAGIVHRDEWVLTKKEVGLLGGPSGVARALRSLGLPGYAGGGHVTAARQSAPVVNVAAPSLEGLQITGGLNIAGAVVPLIDARISAVPGVRAASDFVANHGRFSTMRGR